MKTEVAQDTLEQILLAAGFDVDSILLEERAPGDYVLNIQSQNDPVALIGRNGEVLSALQYLLKNIFRNQGITESGDRILIDVDSYRSKQETNVLDIADSRAQEVLSSGKSVILPPMSPFFRRLVHLHIRENYPNLVTLSQGSGNYRSVCISTGSENFDSPNPEDADVYATIDF